MRCIYLHTYIIHVKTSCVQKNPAKEWLFCKRAHAVRTEMEEWPRCVGSLQIARAPLPKSPVKLQLFCKRALHLCMYTSLALVYVYCKRALHLCMYTKEMERKMSFSFSSLSFQSCTLKPKIDQVHKDPDAQAPHAQF